MKNIAKARELDKKLPQQAKQENSHINELKKEFSSFFEDNPNTSEALDDIEGSVQAGKRYFKRWIKRDKY